MQDDGSDQPFNQDFHPQHRPPAGAYSSYQRSQSVGSAEFAVQVGLRLVLIRLFRILPRRLGVVSTI